jgi:hypothetical protein
MKQLVTLGITLLLSQVSQSALAAPCDLALDTPLAFGKKSVVIPGSETQGPSAQKRMDELSRLHPVQEIKDAFGSVLATQVQKNTYLGQKRYLPEDQGFYAYVDVSVVQAEACVARIGETYPKCAILCEKTTLETPQP